MNWLATVRVRMRHSESFPLRRLTSNSPARRGQRLIICRRKRDSNPREPFASNRAKRWEIAEYEDATDTEIRQCYCEHPLASRLNATVAFSITNPARSSRTADRCGIRNSMFCISEKRL